MKLYFNTIEIGSLWYKTEANLLFPVPISDIGNATFLAKDKAILFMRYIRKWLESLKQDASTSSE